MNNVNLCFLSSSMTANDDEDDVSKNGCVDKLIQTNNNQIIMHIQLMIMTSCSL